MGEFRKRTASELEHEIAIARRDLVTTVQALEVEVRRQLDWRRPIRERPLELVAGALVVGFLLGYL